MKSLNIFALALSLAILPLAGSVYASESAEDQCKAEAQEDGVSAEDMKSYIEACMEAKQQAAKEKTGSGDS